MKKIEKKIKSHRSSTTILNKTNSLLPDINRHDNGDDAGQVARPKSLSSSMKQKSFKDNQKPADAERLEKLLENLNEDTVEKVNFLQIKSIFNNFTPVSLIF